MPEPVLRWLEVWHERFGRWLLDRRLRSARRIEHVHRDAWGNKAERTDRPQFQRYPEINRLTVRQAE